MKNGLPKNPYPGMRLFEFAEGHLFFGREGQSQEVLRRLGQNHFVAVVGTSGSGKSSLVRTGLLPLLFAGSMTEAGSRWRVALFRPGDDPIHNLAVALVNPAQFPPLNTETGNASTQDEDIDLDITKTVLRRSGLGLLECASSNKFPDDENLLVVVDQFEELFRFTNENRSQTAERSETQKKAANDASAFVKLLLEAAREKSNRVYVVITMRSDFLGDCSRFRDLPEMLNMGQYLVPRLSRNQLRSAIESPAAVMGARIEPALVARLLNEIGDDQDQLPVLQHALMRTWDKWAERGNEDAAISFANYQATGGMAAALSLHADHAYEELGDQEKQIAEKLFKCLTVTDRANREVRRAILLGEICAIAETGIDEAVSVIDVFRREGRSFLMPPITEDLRENSVIDLSHESLIRNWVKLKMWVKEEAQAVQIYRRLAEDAYLWRNRKASLWGDPQLSYTLEWVKTFKPNEAWAQLCEEKGEKTDRVSFNEVMEFLYKSDKNQKEIIAEENRRLTKVKRYTVILTTLTILFFIISLIAVIVAVMAYRNN